MATTTDSIVLTTREAKIILDWDDGQWYVSDIDYSTGDDSTDAEGSTGATASTSGGVKVPEWDTSYKYNQNDIVAYEGILYVSDQNQNQGNEPDGGTFWWKPIVDLSAVDAITLEGRNFNELTKAVLGGNLISDYYKKTEVNNILLDKLNNVNARKLENWDLNQIRTEYKSLIEASGLSSEQYVKDYLN